MPAAAVGVDVGGTTTKLVCLEPSGAVRAQASIDSRRADAGTLVQAVVEAAAPWLAGADGAAAVGVAVPGLVDRQAGRVLPGSNLAYLDDFDIVGALGAATGRPVALDNDANAAALAEARFGAAGGCDSAVCLTVGTGIGSALLLDGRLWRGHSGMAGEIGRLLLRQEPDRSLEQEVGAAAVVAAYRERGGVVDDDADAAAVARAAEDGDEAARAALAVCGRWLGVGLAIVINLFNPQRIVIGGGLAHAGDWFLGPAREEGQRRARGPAWDRCEVVISSLGTDAGAIGAALLCDEGTEGQ